MDCSVKKPISQLKPNPQTGLQDTAEKPSDDPNDDEEQCSSESDDESTLESLKKKIQELERIKNKKKKRQEFKAKESRLRALISSLQKEIENLDKEETSNCPVFDENSDERKSSTKTATPWKTVVKKPRSSTKNGSPSTKAGALLLMNIKRSVHKIIIDSKKTGYLIPREFLDDFLETVGAELDSNIGVSAKFFPIYLNFRVFNQLLFLTSDNYKDRERVLEYIKYFGPPKWAGLSTLMYKYRVNCSFYLTDQVKENLGYTKMSPEDFKTFESFYEEGWISFLDLVNDEVIPHDEVRPLFGKLL